MVQSSLLQFQLQNIFAVVLTGSFLFQGAESLAQSGQRGLSAGSESRSAPVQHGSSTQRYQQGSATQDGSSTHAGSGARNASLAMKGFCPVCLVEMKQWVRGNANFSFMYDGKVYYFPEQKQLQMFQAAPEKYAPVLGGDDVVHYAMTGQRVEGKLNNGVRHNGRLFFLSSEQNKQAFRANPNQYADLDLAMRGQCVVCQVEMNQNMPGRPEVVLVHDGIRYQFAGTDQKNMFLANPAKYVSAAKSMPSGDGTQQGSGSQGSEGKRNGSESRGSGTTGQSF